FGGAALKAMRPAARMRWPRGQGVLLFVDRATTKMGVVALKTREPRDPNARGLERSPADRRQSDGLGVTGFSCLWIDRPRKHGPWPGQKLELVDDTGRCC